MQFSITTVPCSQICLVSFLVSRARADNAFEAEFVSPDRILHPEPLEHGVDFIPLRWKPEKQEKDAIIPISYNTYNRLWSRTCFVAGLRDGDKMRPYAMRVGAGNRLDGESKSLGLGTALTRYDDRKFNARYPNLHIGSFDGSP